MASLATLISLIFLTGLGMGYHWRELKDRVKELETKLAESTQLETIPTFISTTPQVVRENKRTGKGPGSETSAIVKTKTAKQLALDKERELNEELDKLGR